MRLQRQRETPSCSWKVGLLIIYPDLWDGNEGVGGRLVEGGGAHLSQSPRSPGPGQI